MRSCGVGNRDQRVQQFVASISCETTSSRRSRSVSVSFFSVACLDDKVDVVCLRAVGDVAPTNTICRWTLSPTKRTPDSTICRWTLSVCGDLFSASPTIRGYASHINDQWLCQPSVVMPATVNHQWLGEPTTRRRNLFRTAPFSIVGGRSHRSCGGQQGELELSFPGGTRTVRGGGAYSPTG